MHSILTNPCCRIDREEFGGQNSVAETFGVRAGVPPFPNQIEHERLSSDVNDEIDVRTQFSKFSRIDVRIG